MNAYLSYNRFTRFFTKHTSTVRGPTVFEINFLGKSAYFSLFLCTGILALNFVSGVLVTKRRSETFGRNAAVIEKEYGEIHRKAFGEDTKLSKFGYPDMGNNLYS